VGFEPLLSRQTKFVVPFLPELSNQGFFQELVSPDPLCTAQGLRAFADFPAVEVDGGHVANFFQSDGIKMARRGLKLRQFPFAIGLFESAEAFPSLGVGGEHAVAAFHNLSDQIAVGVDIRGAFASYGHLCGWV